MTTESNPFPTTEQGPEKGETYTCRECGGIFTAEVSDGDAKAEFEANFGATTQEIPAAVVCDDCYKKIMGWNTGGGGNPIDDLVEAQKMFREAPPDNPRKIPGAFDAMGAALEYPDPPQRFRRRTFRVDGTDPRYEHSEGVVETPFTTVGEGIVSMLGVLYPGVASDGLAEGFRCLR